MYILYICVYLYVYLYMYRCAHVLRIIEGGTNLSDSMKILHNYETCMYKYIFMCIIHKYLYTQMLYIHIYAFICKKTTYVFMYLYICVSIDIYMYIYTYTSVYINHCVRIYT